MKQVKAGRDIAVLLAGLACVVVPAKDHWAQAHLS